MLHRVTQQPWRRWAYAILLMLLASVVLDSLRSPLYEFVAVAGGASLCFYIGLLHLSVLPKGAPRTHFYRIFGLWAIIVGLFVLAVFIVTRFNLLL